jgi:hypothetical protein
VGTSVVGLAWARRHLYRGQYAGLSADSGPLGLVPTASVATGLRVLPRQLWAELSVWSVGFRRLWSEACSLLRALDAPYGVAVTLVRQDVCVNSAQLRH